MGITEDFDEFLILTKCKRATDLLLWRKYYLSLEAFSKEKSNSELVEWVEQFGLLTDLIDDLMDKDKEEYVYLSHNQQELSNCLWSTLQKIKRCVPERNFRKFSDCIALSLLFQSEEDRYTLSESSSETDYDRLVQRSVKLMQSFVYLIDSEPSDAFLKAIECLAIKFQIMNDLDNLRKKSPSDILNKKGTLPLLRLLTYAKKQKDEVLLYLLIHSSCKEKKENIEVIQTALNEQGIQVYCRILAISYHNRAENSFLSICSDHSKISALLMRKEGLER